MYWRTLVMMCVLFGLAARSWAHETDQFTVPPGREFADLGDYFTDFFYRTIERAVNKTNDEIRDAVARGASADHLADLQSKGHIVRTVNGELPWAMDVIEGTERELNSEKIKQRYPGRVTCFKEPIENILQHTHFFLDPRQFFRLFLASTLKVNGVYLGTDKLGHFTDMGMNYYREYEAALKEGKSEQDAVARAVGVGTHGLVLSEEGMLGYLTAGAYSNGDLSANYQGFKFYKNLTDPVMLQGEVRSPMLVRDGPYWKLADRVRRDSDFFMLFISDHLDEALNPSNFEEAMRSAVREAVKQRAQNVLDHYADADGRRRSKQWFDAKRKELETYWGEDYGHRGDETTLITIGNTCFGSSAESAAGKQEVPPLYLSTGLDDANAADNQGQTPLHRAARAGDEPAIRQLIGRGANVNAADRFKTTPLHLAAAQKNAAAVAVLLESKATVNARDDFGCTPLHDAARVGSPEIVSMLLKAGADPKAADAYGTTPLHLACRKYHDAAAHLLLERGADVNAQNTAGVSPLHEAAFAKDAAITRMLLEHHARPDVRNALGEQPADVAASVGNVALVQMLHK